VSYSSLDVLARLHFASESGVLYIGVTNFLERRVAEHKLALIPSVSEKYNTKKLVYFEAFGDIRSDRTRKTTEAMEQN
jgi:predicted GIY-YIG superfamily endonuclease